MPARQRFRSADTPGQRVHVRAFKLKLLQIWFPMKWSRELLSVLSFSFFLKQKAAFLAQGFRRRCLTFDLAQIEEVGSPSG